MGDAFDLFEITATPSRLAQYLAPKIWGPTASYRADPWVLALEAGCVNAISDRERQRFVKGNAPPQIGKSMYDEVFLPFWCLGLWPETRVILVGYNDGIAMRSGGMVRDLVRLYGMELFGIELDPDYTSKGDWKLNGHLGGMLSVGIGSMITGRSAELLIIGDIIKNMEEAASKTAKNLHWEEFQGSMLPRLQPGATVLLFATRFADDDLSGRIDMQCNEPTYEGEPWETFVFPAIAEPRYFEDDVDDDWRDIIGRRQGEPLQCRYSRPGDELPENWESSHFYRVRRQRDAYTFSAIYQQEPTSQKGSMFDKDNWGWYDPTAEPPTVIGQRRVWDLSSTEGGGDFTVGTKVWKVSNNNDFWIVDVQRMRKASSGVKQHVELIAATDGLLCPIMIEQERSGAGRTIVEFYRMALPLHEVRQAIPDGKKHERARPYSTLQQQGKIKLPRYPDGSSPPWVDGFIDEHRKMMADGRVGRHDDQIDTAAYAINDMLDTSLTLMLEPDLIFTGQRGLVLIE